MQFLKNLEWRYATKRFDPTKTVSDEHLKMLMESIRLSVSSYGLQLYKVLVIRDQEIRAKLKPASWNQDQITEASHLMVFCNYTEVKDNHIDDFVRLSARERNTPVDTIAGYGEFMKKALRQKSDDELKSWLEKQPYLALSNLLSACAELKIDACPMEGFVPDDYNRILGLDKMGLNACVIAPIGYRHSADSTQFLAKVRRPAEELFAHIS